MTHTSIAPRAVEYPSSDGQPMAETPVHRGGKSWKPCTATGAGGRITLLVSHRFSTVPMADLIVVLDGTRVVEVGSHQELADPRFPSRFRRCSSCGDLHWETTCRN